MEPDPAGGLARQAASGTVEPWLRRVYRLLASWKLSVALTVTGSLYYVFLTIWGARSPAHVVQSIAGLLPFTLFYILLLSNTLLCILWRFRGLMAAMRKAPLDLPSNRDWERVERRPPVFRGNAARVENGYLWVYRRYSALGTILLHGSLFLIALGFLLSHHTHVEGSFKAGLHDELKVDASTFERTTPRDADRRLLPEAEVVVHDISTSFWRDELLFTRFTADLSVNGRPRAVAINDPAFLTPFSYLRLTSFGYAPVYMVVAEGQDRPLEEGAMILNIFPPGTRGLLRLRNFPHRVYLRLYPDHHETENGPASRSMRLDNPRVVVEIYRGKVFVTRKTLRFGEPLTVEEFTLSILGVVPSAELTLVRDAGLPFILAGFLVLLAGLLLRLPGRRQEILAQERPDGQWLIMGKNIPEGVA
jgi:hypothetical protein